MTDIIENPQQETPIDPAVETPNLAQPSDDEVKKLMMESFSEKYQALVQIFVKLPIDPKLRDFAAMNLDQGFRWAIEAISLIKMNCNSPNLAVDTSAPTQ